MKYFYLLLSLILISCSPENTKVPKNDTCNCDTLFYDSIKSAIHCVNGNKKIVIDVSDFTIKKYEYRESDNKFHITEWIDYKKNDSSLLLEKSLFAYATLSRDSLTISFIDDKSDSIAIIFKEKNNMTNADTIMSSEKRIILPLVDTLRYGDKFEIVYFGKGLIEGREQFVFGILKTQFSYLKNSNLLVEYIKLYNCLKNQYRLPDLSNELGKLK